MTIFANLKYYSTHIKNTQKIHTYKEVKKKAMLTFSFRLGEKYTKSHRIEHLAIRLPLMGWYMNCPLHTIVICPNVFLMDRQSNCCIVRKSGSRHFVVFSLDDSYLDFSFNMPHPCIKLKSVMHLFVKLCCQHGSVVTWSRADAYSRLGPTACIE